MPITAYVGNPGSGKSYGVVEHVILPALKSGRRIWTNIPLELELLEQEFEGKITLFNIIDIQRNPAWFQDVFEAGATIVIDEAWDLWPAGLKATNALQGHKEFIAKHRHMVGTDNFSTEIVLVTQKLGDIAMFARNKVDFTYWATKLEAVGASKSYRIDVYQGVATGDNPPKRNRLRQILGKYQESVWKYYKSQTMSTGSQHGSEKMSDSRVNIFNSKFLKVGVPVLVGVLLFIIWYGLSGLKSMYGDIEQLESDSTWNSATDTPLVESKSQPAIQKKHKHFFDGMDSYIAFNLGRAPWVQYRIAFFNDDKLVVFDADQLGKMGYTVIGHDQCYLTIEGYDEILHVFCQPEEPEQESLHKPIVQL